MNTLCVRLSLYCSLPFLLSGFICILVNKMSPRPSLIPTDTDASYGNYQQQQQDAAANQNNNNNNNTTNTTTSTTGSGGPSANKQNTEPGRRAGACRVCLKSFKPDDFHKTCFECQQRVCEDCASYSKLEENEDAVSNHLKLLVLHVTRICFSNKEMINSGKKNKI